MDDGRRGAADALGGPLGAAVTRLLQRAIDRELLLQALAQASPDERHAWERALALFDLSPRMTRLDAFLAAWDERRLLDDLDGGAEDRRVPS